MLRVRVLGELSLELDGEPLDPPASRRARSLLAWLAMHPGAHPRGQLAARFWPDVLDSSARASLRTTLHELRRDLGSAGRHLEAGREHVALQGGAELWVDARAFAALVADGRWRDALALQGGELLAGLDEEWVYDARDRHRERVVEVLERLAAEAEQAADRDAALRWTREQVELDPISEELHRRLIRRLGAAGDRPAALAAYERLRERLRRQLGLAPSAETRALAERLRGEPAAEAAEQPPAAPPAPLPALLRRRRRSAFVGREAHLELLAAHLDATGSGERRLVVVGGEPGIGKTRLAGELCRRAHAGGATVLFGRCFEEPLVPYQAFVEALGHFVAARPSEELSARLGPSGGELAGLVPQLTARLPDLPRPVEGDPEGARWRLFEAVDALLVAESATGPTVLALDDLHWADRDTLLLLAHLARSPAPARLLLVGTYRASELSDDHPLAATLADLAREHLLERVALGGLDAVDVGRLVTAWIGPQAPPDLDRALHGRTEGNPFFVEELLRHLAESGALQRHAGHWSEELLAGAAGVPESVTEVIGRRLARLGDRATRVLGAAAVAGGEFDLDVLERLEELAGHSALTVLEEAMAAQMVREVPTRPGRYGFAHALIRETLYRRLSLARRVRLHAAIADAVEELYAGHLEPHLGELAHHRLEAAAGGGTGPALDSALRAAESAMAKLAYEDAAAHCERALAALDGRDDVPPAQRCDLLLGRGEALLRAGNGAAAREAFGAAAGVARELGDGGRLGRAALGFSGLGVTIIRVDPESVALVEEALAVLRPRADTRALGLCARLVARLAVELYYASTPERRKALGDEAVELARRSGDDAAVLDALNARHVALWSPAYLDERLSTADEMIALAAGARDPEREMQGRNWRVLDLAERGDLEAMRLEIERHEELADRLRLPTYQWWGPMWRTTLAILEGRWTEAEELLERFRATGRRAHDANAELYFELQRHGLALERERTSEVDESMLDRQLGGPVEAAYRSGYAWVCALEGRDDEARRHLHWVTADALARLPEDMNRLAALCELAQACALLGESAVAPSIHEQLAPYAERHVINARASAGYGAAAHHLGELAVVMSQPTKARVHFEDALRVNAALGSRPWLARTQLRYGELLLAEGAAQDRPRAVELLDAAWAAAADLGLGSVARRAEARLSEPAPPAPVRSC